MSREIVALGGHLFFVDEDDFAMMSKYRWFKDSKGYAIANTPRIKGKKTTVKMHRLITGAKIGEVVDHINGDPADNRKINLRITTQSQNTKNVTTRRRNNASGYKGVSWDRKKKKWMAKITVNYRAIYLGRHESKVDAAKAYNEAAIKYFGEFARLNEFPKEDE
ncbi:AP2 domain-containing protein [Bacillus velezensis]|uniref:AP2 domain-containing protein n=1 Tax=Bacillus velezensis TaxID=492670 RepID=UPI002148BDF6|nr:AP2 domain-containing protein [Bacillus velezensis]UUT18437.1 AP2 domain-containing protein [Bacillus velezensis]